MEGGNVLAAVLCLALAHRAKIACGKLQQTSVGVMGVVTVEHVWQHREDNCGEEGKRFAGQESIPDEVVHAWTQGIQSVDL